MGRRWGCGRASAHGQARAQQQPRRSSRVRAQRVGAPHRHRACAPHRLSLCVAQTQPVRRTDTACASHLNSLCVAQTQSVRRTETACAAHRHSLCVAQTVTCDAPTGGCAAHGGPTCAHVRPRCGARRTLRARTHTLGHLVGPGHLVSRPFLASLVCVRRRVGSLLYIVQGFPMFQNGLIRSNGSGTVATVACTRHTMTFRRHRRTVATYRHQ